MPDSALTWLYEHLGDLFAIVGWLMIMLPSIIYLLTTWRARRDRLFARLTPEAVKIYYQQFRPSLLDSVNSDDASDAEVKSHFARHFDKLYGRRHYILPLTLLALVAGIGLWGTARSIRAWVWPADGLQPYPPVVVSAFLGAYTWVLYDQLRRFRSGDFTSHDVYAGVFRFIIAVPLGLSFAAIVRPEVGVALVFLLAAFPTHTLFKYARRLSTTQLNLGESEEGASTELEKLQSIGKSNAERYYDEGVTTIVELAWADPIELSIKTNRQFSFVIDTVSQALLWVYFQDDVKKLYPLSLRGAQEVTTLLDELASEDTEVRERAEATMKSAAALMGMDEKSFQFTLLVVTEDPYSKFLYSIWT